MKTGIAFKTILILLFLIPVCLIINKLLWGNYMAQTFLPETLYEVSFDYSFNGNNKPSFVKTFIPQSNNHQTISNVSNRSRNFDFTIKNDKGGIIGKWRNKEKTASEKIKYSFTFQGKAIKYTFPKNLTMMATYPDSLQPFLQEEKYIEVNHPKIKAVVEEKISGGDDLLVVIQSIYDFVYQMPSIPTAQLTTALQALEANEASCNGKSRLLVAMCRNKGIPANLVGGMILQPGSKRTSHQWAEIWMGSQWIPFDALNGHFAYLPENYMELYHNDHFLMAHTPDIQFEYMFHIEKQAVLNPALGAVLKADSFNAYSLWEWVAASGASLSLLKIILLLPLGAVIVSLFRNVIGMKTFGVFLPALIAVSVSSLGFIEGMSTFIAVVLIVSLLHYPLENWGILYTPKLVIMLISVVGVLLGLSALGVYNKISTPEVIFFPIVILTITAERFARSMMEETYADAAKTFFQTLIVTSFCYIIFASTTLEIVLISFPELFLILVAFMLLLGRWIGLRVSEYPRFKFINH